MQTLTSLHLCDNKIRDVGAEHLATALRENTVTFLHVSSATHSLSHADTQIA